MMFDASEIHVVPGLQLERPYHSIAQAIDAYYSRYREISLDLFANPELGRQEFYAVRTLAAELERLGFQVETGYCGMPTAFRADPPVINRGPKVALLPEYDALPEVGHACGHNLIAASCLAAAVGVLAVAPELKGSFTLIGAPDEETAAGKAELLERGGYPDIDYALSVHPGTENATRRQYRAASSFLVIFNGKTAHAAATPERGINALDALVDFYQAFRELRDAQPQAVSLNAVIREGGLKTNIIPDRCVAEVNIRTPDQAGTDIVTARIHELAEQAAARLGARVEYQPLQPKYREMKTDIPLVETYEANLVRLGVGYDISLKERTGSTDVANLSHEFPTIHPWMRIVAEGNPENISGHHRCFAEASASEFGHRQMLLAAKAMAFTVYDLLK